jgi:hypothetical protein
MLLCISWIALLNLVGPAGWALYSMHGDDTAEKHKYKM